MDHVRSIIRLIEKGLAAQVMLPDGSLITEFSPHDIIVRGNPEAGILVVRGIVGLNDAAGEDKVIPLCDIRAVFSETPHRAALFDSGFQQRNPVPRGWAVIHARRAEAET